MTDSALWGLPVFVALALVDGDEAKVGMGFSLRAIPTTMNLKPVTWARDMSSIFLPSGPRRLVNCMMWQLKSLLEPLITGFDRTHRAIERGKLGDRARGYQWEECGGRVSFGRSASWGETLRKTDEKVAKILTVYEHLLFLIPHFLRQYFDYNHDNQGMTDATIFAHCLL